MKANTEIIPKTVGSDKPADNKTDDTLKDIDNLVWVTGLAEDEMMEWLLFCRWVRQADRYLERDVYPQLTHHPEIDGSYTFQDFISHWRKLRRGEEVVDSPEADLFRSLKRRWKREGLQKEDLQVWDLYLASLKRYVRPGLVIADMTEYQHALYGLSGTFFQGFPSTPKAYRSQIGALGVLDQFYNNLRDLREDTARDINYFPAPLLAKFEIKPEEVAELIGKPNDRLVRLIRYLLTSFVPSIKGNVRPMLSPEWIYSGECPYSWRLMILNNMHRYDRVEDTLETCGYNSEEFDKEYWDRVKQEWPSEDRERFQHLTSTLKM